MVLVVVQHVVLAVQVDVIILAQTHAVAAQAVLQDVNKVALLHVHLIVQEYVKDVHHVVLTVKMVVTELVQ